MRLGLVLAFLLLFFLQLFLFLRVLFLQLLGLRLVLLLDLLFFRGIRLLLRELCVFLLLLLLNSLTILLLVCVKLILLLLVLPVQLAVRSGLYNRPSGSRNLVRVNCWRSRPIGLRWLRRSVWINRTIRRAVIQRSVGRLAVRCSRLVCVRIGIIRWRRPVSVAVWRWRRVIRCRWPNGLHWFGGAARICWTIPRVISRWIVRLHSFRRGCLRRFIRGGRPVGLDRLRSAVGIPWTIPWAGRRGIAGLHSLRRCCLRRLIRDRRPIGLHWFGSFAEIRGTFCHVVSGLSR